VDDIVLNAYAKINLTLDVIGKRENGYHDLEMIMQSVDLFDRILVRKNDTGKINIYTDSEKIPVDKSNIAYKAAEKMIKTYNIKNGVDIVINKNIPVAAGLAGGSTDAAAVINGMRKIFLEDVDEREILNIASEIGKDVPFCLKGGTAFAYGLGDEILQVENSPLFYVVLAKPDIDVSTAEVYKALKIDEIKIRPDTRKVLEAIEDRDSKTIAKECCNVLETVTAEKYPIIYDIKKTLKECGAMTSLMSGSGPTVYGLFDNKKKADEAADFVSKKFNIKEVFSTKTKGKSNVKGDFEWNINLM